MVVDVFVEFLHVPCCVLLHILVRWILLLHKLKAKLH
jgi:hypothetical protein